MVDRKFIGHLMPEAFVDVEAGQLRFFAKATGETDPIYSNLEAAKAAGHPALPAPPTFQFSLELIASEETGSVLDLVGVDIGRVLHGEQRFTYSGQIYAGDRIRLSRKIADIYSKKGGALEFIVQESEAFNQNNVKVGTARTVTVVRNG